MAEIPGVCNSGQRRGKRAQKLFLELQISRSIGLSHLPQFAMIWNREPTPRRMAQNDVASSLMI